MIIKSSSLIFLTFIFGWVLSIFQMFSFSGVSISLLLILPLLFIIPYEKSCSNLTMLAFSFLVISLSFPIIFNISSVHSSTFTHFMQSILCLIVFCIFSTIKLSEDIVETLINIILVSIVICCSYGIYQFFARLYSLPFDYLPMTNLQISADEGMQRGYSNQYLHNIIFSRVSSFFSEPSEFGRYLLLTFPFIFFCYHSKTKYIILSLMVVSLLLTQSIASISIGFIVFSLYLISKGKFYSIAYVMFIPLLIMILWGLASFHLIELGSLDRFEKIYKLGWGYLDETARFKDTFIVLDIVFDNLVSGLGIGRISDVVNNYVVANLFFLLLIERGLVFTLMFLSVFILPLFFKRESQLSKAMFYVVILQLLFFINFSMMYFIPMYAFLGLSYNKKIYNKH